jgi:hypothetical protein
MPTPVEEFLCEQSEQRARRDKLEKRGMDVTDAAEAAEFGSSLGVGKGFGKSRLLKSLGRGLALGSAFALGSAAVAGLGRGAQKMFDAITKKRDFDRMLAHNPHLQRDLERDPEAFGAAFSALRRMNPALSRDPLVAGAYMFETLEQPPETRGFVAVKALREQVPERLGPASEAALLGFQRALAVKPRDLYGYFEGPESGRE